MRIKKISLKIVDEYWKAIIFIETRGLSKQSSKIA